MTSGLDLDRFLGELSTRQERILTLADPSSAPSADLVDELRDLGQQLVVADEELRVQQEELESARGALLSLAAERDLLLQHSTRAYVVTDETGVVLHTTRTAQQLVRQPQARVVPRPIASWFAVADRRAVRGMVSRTTAGAPARAVGLHLAVAGGEEVVVDLVATRVTPPGERPALLRWELLPAPSSTLTPPQPVAPDRAGGTGPELALRVAEAALELQTCRTTEELLARTRTVALRLVAGAQDARLVLPEDGPGRADPDERADAAEEGSAGDAGPWCVPLVVGDRRLGTLVLDIDPAERLPGAAVGAAALGAQVALALHRQRELEDLRRAVEARQLVGQAVGILAARRAVPPEAAFALLVKESQDRNVKLRALARSLVDTVREPRARP